MIDKFIEIVKEMGYEEFIINFIVVSFICLIYLRVFKNFKDSKLQKDRKKKEVKSIVETFSMTMFFVLCMITIKLKIGVYSYHNIYLIIFALVIYIIGGCVNLLGRYYLGHNWGNNVVIYTDHSLVRNGVYKVVRHPLYASIIWMIYSLGVIYQNYLIFILNTVIFIPFMYYRAKQEEKELIKVFAEYKDYQHEVGMFFPKLIFRKEVK